MISVSSSGSLKNTESFLKAMTRIDSVILNVMRSCGQQGVRALSDNTPVDSGLTASSWYFQVSVKGGFYRISWCNSDIEKGFPVAIMLQYGYATGTGGYVQGHDYINPAIKPIFDQIRDKVWKAVTSS